MTFLRRLQSMRTFLLLFLIFTINLLTRTMFISSPKSPVFDEAYYVKYSHSYACGLAYTDLHPPLPKILYHWASGVEGCVSSLLENDADAYNANMMIIGRMRLLHAVVGSCTAVIVTMLTLLVSGSLPAAALAGLWISLENATVLQSSFVLLEQFLLFGIFGAMVCYILALKSRRPFTVRLLSISTGAMIAIAVGTKFTGLCVAAGLGIHLAYLVRKKIVTLRNLLPRVSFALAGFLAFYLAVWGVHETTLYPKYYADFNVDSLLNFSDRIVFHHWQMLSGHMSLGDSDPSGSRWFQWLVGLKPLLFWAAGERWIIFFPNHVIWVGSGVLLLCMLSAGYVFSIQRAGSFAGWLEEVGMVAAMVIVNFVPNFFIHRVLYMYQYVPALCGLIVLNCWILSKLVPANGLKSSSKRLFVVALIVLPLFSAFFSSFFSHGTLMTKSGEWRKRYYDPAPLQRPAK